MIDTVWKIGDTVYGVHSEVDNSTCYIYVVKERIVYIKETGGWRSEGKIHGTPVYSDLLSYKVFFDKESAVAYAESLYAEALRQSMQNSNTWKDVVRKYDE